MPRRRGGPRLVTRKGKPSYFIRYIDVDGKQKDRSTGTTDRDQAEEALAEFLRERRAPARPRDHSKILIAELLTDYAEFVKHRKSTAERLGYAMVHLLEFWQDKPVSTYNKETVQAYRLGAGRASSTVRRELVCLRTALNHAASLGRMLPVPQVALPEDSPPRDRWLTIGEAAKLLRSARKDYRSRFTLSLFIVIAIHTAQRMGAILELEWTQIDFRTGLIEFNKPGVAKTKKGRARMPMSPILQAHLLRRFQKYGHKTPFVFHQLHPPHARVWNIAKGFRAACKRANLKRVTPHTLRHTAISWALQRSENRFNLSRLINLSPETIDAVYGHHDPQNFGDIAKRM